MKLIYVLIIILIAVVVFAGVFILTTRTDQKPEIIDFTILPENPIAGKEATLKISAKDDKGLKGFELSIGEKKIQVDCNNQRTYSTEKTYTISNIKAKEILLTLTVVDTKDQKTTIQKRVVIIHETLNPVCGNNLCESNETKENCPEDCKLDQDGEEPTEKANDFKYAFVSSVTMLSSFTQAKKEFIAKHFDSVEITGGANATLKQILDDLKSINSDFEATKYTNGPFDYAYKPTNEECYLHEPINSRDPADRLKDSGYGGFGMDVCSQCWREYFLTQAAQDMQFSFDGVMVDDMSTQRSRFNPDLTSYTAEEWHNCKKDFLNYLKTHSQGKIVIFNGLYNNPNDSCSDFLQVSDGGIKEGFIIKIATYDKFISQEDWKAFLNFAISSLPENKSFVANCKFKKNLTSDNDRMFCFTSFLLVNSSNIFYTFKNSNLEEPQYYPEMNVTIGTPAETQNSLQAYYSNGVYVRNYSNGKVIVSPETSAISYDLDKTYYRVIPHGGGVVTEDGTYGGSLSYEEVTTVSVPAQSGVILLNQKP